MVASKHVIYYVSHLIGVKNVLSRFMRPAPDVLRIGMDLHFINSSQLIKDVSLRHYLEKLYADNAFDTETSDKVIMLEKIKPA